MSTRTATVLLVLAAALGILAWFVASRPEATPSVPEPEALPGAAPTPLPPSAATPRPAPPAGQPVEAPPGVPGSSAAAPPAAAPAGPGAPAAAPGDTTAAAAVPHFPLDAGVRFPISTPGIRAALADAKPEMQECYEEWLKVNPALAGRLKIRFRITGDGGAEATVDQVGLIEDAGMGNVAFEGCVLSVMSGLRFDAPKEGSLTVNYPLVFSNDGGPPPSPP